MKLVLTLLCCIVLSQNASGQSSAPGTSEFDEHTRKGIDFVYNLEFENASREFDALVQLKPGHPAGHFFLAMVQWWQILIDIDNDQYDEKFHDALDGVVDLCDEMLEVNENDVTALFFKGGAIGFKGRLNAHRSEWLAAANAGRKALPIVQDASALDPNNYDILLGSGIYNYYAEVIPQEYAFVKPLLLFVPNGDKKKGIEQLTAAAERGKYASVEASYFLMQIYHQFERDFSKALGIAQTLNARFPANMLFHKYLGRCYVSLGNWPKVHEVFGEISARARKDQRGYNVNTEREAEYYLALYEMSQRAHDKALAHFYRCDELSRQIDTEEVSGFMVMTNLKVGNIYDVQMKRESAVEQYKKVLGMREHKDSHKQAQQFLLKPFIQ
ncbi:MAG: tetratricopeptide repeat protein [Bacteroidota bacterium]